jgi:DNA-binding NarL/FixJ family response regulator
MTTRVLLADDHPVFAAGLRQVIASEREFEVVAACSNGQEALTEIHRKRPDIAIVDLSMPVLDGMGVLRAVADEGLPTAVVLLTASVSDEEVLEAIRLGVRGIVLKELAPQLIITCLQRVAAGGQWLEKNAIGKALEKMLRREGGLQEISALLTTREMEIARLAGSGMRNKDIANKLFIAEGTVKVHLHSVYEKLNVRTRYELMLYVRDKGLT